MILQLIVTYAPRRAYAIWWCLWLLVHCHASEGRINGGKIPHHHILMLCLDLSHGRSLMFCSRVMYVSMNKLFHIGTVSRKIVVWLISHFEYFRYTSTAILSTITVVFFLVLKYFPCDFISQLEMRNCSVCLRLLICQSLFRHVS